MMVTRTYLELRSLGAFLPAFGTFPDLRITRVADPTAALYRELYRGVGRDYHWRDRWNWTDREIAAHLSQPAIRLYLAMTGQNRVGFYELKTDDHGNGGRDVEIAYFGLFPGQLGRGLGKHLLSHAVTEAFGLGATRVWLHTCTLDHPAALPNYVARGFAPFKTEQYEVEKSLDSPLT
jgi:ribosomal protein S18 acetylase RimI-like enzyme